METREMETTAVDIDVLLGNIRKEALALEQPSQVEFRPVNLALSVDLPAQDISRFAIKRCYQRNDFLPYQDVEFVTNAFRGILQREPDETGLDDYLNALRNGGCKLFIIASLMLSEEAQARGVIIKGMRGIVPLYRLQRALLKFGAVSKPVVAGLTRVVRYLEAARGINGQTLTEMERTQQRYLGELVSSLTRILSDVKDQLSGQLSANQALQLSHKQLQHELAAVRLQLSYQQRNQDIFLDELRHSADADGFSPTQQQAVLESHRDDKFDAYYVAFEDACRGSRDEIRHKFAEYLPLLDSVMADNADAEAQLLDVGCGRGEWLELVSERGWQAKGLDLNKVMVQQCQELSLSAEEADLIEYLRAQPDASLLALTGFHIIEHLPFASLFALFEEAIRVLRPGGLVLFETPNPENLLVGSHTFYHDPTHKNPITPTSIEFLARYIGFEQTEIRRLHPYPETAKVVGIDPLTERVNGHLCGPQDFSIIARKP